MLTIDPEDIPARDGDVIVDLGCGEGRHTIGFSVEKVFCKKNLLFIGHDIDKQDLTTAKSRLHDTQEMVGTNCANASFARSDIYSLPHADQSVNHIICSEVLEHLHDYHQALSEMTRILKVGGTLAISVPRGWSEKICWKLSKEYHQVPGGHVRIFDRKTLLEEISSKGFTLKRSYGKHALHMPYWWLRCVFWSKGDNFFLTKIYHRLLVWDLLKRPWLTRAFDKLCNPWLGKSVVLVFVKNSTASEE